MRVFLPVPTCPLTHSSSSSFTQTAWPSYGQNGRRTTLRHSSMHSPETRKTRCRLGRPTLVPQLVQRSSLQARRCTTPSSSCRCWTNCPRVPSSFECLAKAQDSRKSVFCMVMYAPGSSCCLGHAQVHVRVAGQVELRCGVARTVDPLFVVE